MWPAPLVDWSQVPVCWHSNPVSANSRWPPAGSTETPMPTYEYRCRDCSHELEAQQSFSDPALTECPTCGGTLRKKFSAVGISFKGKGFYKTDSRSSSSAGS